MLKRENIYCVSIVNTILCVIQRIEITYITLMDHLLPAESLPQLDFENSRNEVSKFIFANKNTKRYMKELKLKIQSDLTKKY